MKALTDPRASDRRLYAADWGSTETRAPRSKPPQKVRIHKEDGQFVVQEIGGIYSDWQNISDHFWSRDAAVRYAREHWGFNIR